MQRPCRALNYSSSELIYRTITSYTGTTTHEFSLVISPILVLNLLSRIGREKTPQLFDTLLLFFSVTQKAEHQQNLLKPAALCNVVALPKHKI